MQSLILSLSGRIEALAEFYHVFLRQKENLWEMDSQDSRGRGRVSI